MGIIKKTNIKIWTYYFFDGMINIKKFDKNVGDYESIYSGNSLYFIVGEVDRYIEEKMAISTQILLL